MDTDADSSSVVSSSADSVASAAPREKTEEAERRRAGGGVIEAVLLLVVRLVLAGVQGAVVLEWLLGKVSEALFWAVELGMILVQPPS